MSYLYGPKVIKDKVISNISAAIREIHRLVINNDNKTTRAITNDDWQVHCLLEHLDFALLFGLRHVQDGYYKFVSEFTPKPLLEQIESLLNVETDIGRGRAWLFFAFNDNLTESYLKCFQDNKKLIKNFYASDAIVNDTQRLIALITLCSGLENVQFDLKVDCVYFDRSCWPAYLQMDLKDTEKLSLPGIRNDIPSFDTYLSRYDIQHPSSASTTMNSTTVASRRVRVPKQPRQKSTESSVANSFISSDIHPTTLSRSSSVSFDNPSINESLNNDENQTSISQPIPIDSSVPLSATVPKPSSSLSELDPMFTNRPQTPSPIASTIVDENPKAIPIDDKLTSIEVITNEQSSIGETQSQITTEDSSNVSEQTEQSSLALLSASNDHDTNELNVDNSSNDLLKITENDPLEITADANLQLQFILEIYEKQNKEQMIRLFSTSYGHNYGDIEIIFLLVTTVNVYLLRQTKGINDSYQIEKVESIPLEYITSIEVGPNEQFLRIITVTNAKRRSFTTGCVELTRAICASISEATNIGRFPEPKIISAAMQELSIKRVLANDVKKSNPNDVRLLDYHYAFWEEPQMSGRKLRKEGLLYLKLVEPSTTIRRLGAATLKAHRQPFETWRNAYVTLRVDRLNIYLNKSDKSPTLSYTLLDENCQGCRRNRNSDRQFTLELIFTNDTNLLLATKSKTEQDEWLNAIMKGLSQGRMAMKDEENSANTIPCSVTLTEDKIYICHDEQDNALIRQLDSMRLEYIVRLLVDPEYKYYCVLSIEHGNQGSKSWIFYFLFSKEMIQFIEILRKTLSQTYQVPFDIHPLEDISFQNDCERTSKRLLRSYRPLTLIA